jgi:phosphoribosyl 1,2-cyclic phosphodiesterase
VEVRLGSTLVIFDAGTGIRELGEDLARRNKAAVPGPAGLRVYIFFSHLHWDHVQGFPFFCPVFVKGNEIHLYGGSGLNRTVRGIMADQMCSPNFPVGLDELEASLTFHDLHPGERVSVDGATVLAEPLNHPGGSFGYRLEENGKVVTYASDTEHGDASDRQMLILAQNADLLIHDSMFTPEQYLGVEDDVSRQSWGHSTWEGAVETARAANVKRLVLFHHGNEDKIVEQIERCAQALFPNTIAAYEGLEIKL